LNREEPVRRRLHTSIMEAALMNGKSLNLRRGCELYPGEVKFGILREGFTYITDFQLINVGVDTCRFKVKQPPPQSGIKILFKPGPVSFNLFFFIFFFNSILVFF
jgi:hypothetical protein